MRVELENESKMEIVSRELANRVSLPREEMFVVTETFFSQRCKMRGHHGALSAISKTDRVMHHKNHIMKCTEHTAKKVPYDRACTFAWGCSGGALKFMYR